MRRAMKWGASLGRMTAWIAGMLMLLACQSGPQMLSVPVTGYNHTSAVINRFSVNGAGGPNIGPNEGGGKQVCCGALPRHWSSDLKVTVEWEKDPNTGESTNWPPLGTDAYREAYRKHAAKYTQHRAVGDIPQYGEKVCALQVHFLPCDQVRVSTTCYTPTNPNYPDREYFQMKESAACPVL
ncbi:DUF3304 domain-containing protein [Pseudomonas chlororaphis]|uniref:DUF3304 domain-containing protein n=1 Tax=Pseudomonas chlororaphis TaxID=587753 RepID=UPI001CF40ABB|nr:DUF3304 domain-containing protein [Pseudomonas chlororaphis]